MAYVNRGCSRQEAILCRAGPAAPAALQVQLRELEMDPKKLLAEAIGTFWLTFGGCGSAVIAAAFPHVGIGLVGVSLAFGLTLLTMAYSIGHVSGCHINPAVTIGLTAGGRFPASQIGPYVAAQIVGAIIGAALLYVIARGAPDFTAANGFAANGYGEHSPGHYDLLSCFITEVVMTAVFLFIIMGSTHGRAPVGFAPIAIGLGLTLIHLRQHSRDQYFRQPSAQHRARTVRGQLGPGPALAVHRGSDHWRCPGRYHLPLDLRTTVSTSRW
jgi:aquaporin Z